MRKPADFCILFYLQVYQNWFWIPHMIIASVWYTDNQEQPDFIHLDHPILGRCEQTTIDEVISPNFKPSII